jgi:hypothetical protein
MIELLLLLFVLDINDTGHASDLYNHVYSEHKVYLDKEGKHMILLKFVDKIKRADGGHATGFYSAPEGILIQEGRFGHVMIIDDRAPQYQGCTPFLHERYHAKYGDWLHHDMPYGCEGVW